MHEIKHFSQNVTIYGVSFPHYSDLLPHSIWLTTVPSKTQHSAQNTSHVTITTAVGSVL